jgi:hypothetical protein
LPAKMLKWWVLIKREISKTSEDLLRPKRHRSQCGQKKYWGWVSIKFFFRVLSVISSVIIKQPYKDECLLLWKLLLHYSQHSETVFLTNTYLDYKVEQKPWSFSKSN